MLLFLICFSILAVSCWITRRAKGGATWPKISSPLDTLRSCLLIYKKALETRAGTSMPLMMSAGLMTTNFSVSGIGYG